MARDKFHYIVRTALEKDGWTITHDPYPLQLTRRKLGIDLGAEKVIAAVRELEKIAVFDLQTEQIVLWKKWKIISKL